MAKDYTGMKKSNSHMNGFGQMDITKGHKHMGKAPMSDAMMEDQSAKKKSKAKKAESSMKTDFDGDMDSEE